MPMDFTTIMLDISLFLGLYFQIFLLVSFFEAEENEEKLILPAILPTVTIIVPCFNEAKTVEKTILSLMGLNYPMDKLNILVVDDGSVDETYANAQLAAKRFPNVRVVTQKNGGKYTALNLGICECTTDIVGCLDADSMVHPDALIKMIPYFNDLRTMAVTPAMRVHQSKTFLQQIQRAEYNVGIFTKRVFGYLDAINVTPGPFSIFRRTVFDIIGPFHHAHNTEDMEIAFRIQSHGFRIANCYDALVYTITPPTFKKLYRQRTRWSYGLLKNLIDYKHIILNKKYGNMGMLTLPFAIVGIVFVFYFAGSFIYQTLRTLGNDIERMLLVGVRVPEIFTHSIWATVRGTLNEMYYRFDMTSVLALMLFATSVYIIFKSKKMSEGNMKPSRDIFYFICFYSLIAPLWLGKAVYNVLLSKKTPWR